MGNRQSAMRVIVSTLTVFSAPVLAEDNDFVINAIGAYVYFGCAALAVLNSTPELQADLMNSGYILGGIALEEREKIHPLEQLGAPLDFMMGTTINSDFTLGMIAGQAQLSALRNKDAPPGSVQVARTDGELVTIECARL
jgi:hypothetical protein